MANYSKLKVIWRNNLNNIYKENTIIGVGQEAVINIDENSISNIYVNFKVNNDFFTDLVEINGNVIQVPFKTDVLKEGTHQLEIVAYLENGDVIPSPTFSYHVEKSLENPNDITAETNYPILIQLLEEVEEWNENVKRKEIERQENENTRISNENTRISNEDTRISNETNRRQYEDTRRIEEDERLTLEEQRQNAELQRIANENERLRREVRRQDNEQNRIIRFNEMEAMVAEVEADVEEFERNLNTDVQQFKIDTNAAMIAHKNEVSEVIDGFGSQLTEIENEKSKKVDYLTPKMFGAKGDGQTDDTEALRNAIYQSHNTGKMLYFPNDCKCLISGALNYYNGEYYNVTLNIRGVLPSARWEYALSKYGGICIKNDCNVFYGKTISGEISNLSVTGVRSEGVHFFDNCHLSSIYIHGCNITNFGAFLYDSEISGVSRIDSNTFLTNFYFHRAVNKYTTITDSYITNNYINGGAEPTNNACFEFQSGNGSTIQGNFIDYYKVIYRPVGQARVEFPTSIGNQYQVFLYLYEVTHGGSYKFSSIGDTFNWTDETKLEKLKTYEKSTYTGQDGNTYEKPTYIASVRYSSSVIIKNANIQSNVGNIIFFEGHTGEYALGEFECDFVGITKYNQGKIALLEGSTQPYYHSGAYTYNTCKPYFIEKVDSLPAITSPWNSHPIGYMVRYNNENYKLIKKNDDNGNRVAQWVKFDDM